VFLPGRVPGSANVNFEEEWKPIDQWGRLLRDRVAKIATNADVDWQQRAHAGADG
jgi:hypothetical protein